MKYKLSEVIKLYIILYYYDLYYIITLYYYDFNNDYFQHLFNISWHLDKNYRWSILTKFKTKTIFD